VTERIYVHWIPLLLSIEGTALGSETSDLVLVIHTRSTILAGNVGNE